jgi:hypothetical protein
MMNSSKAMGVSMALTAIPQDPLAWTPELATDDAHLPWLGFFFRMGFLAGDIYARSTR